MLKIYFKPNCATCITTLKEIKKNTDDEIQLIEYLEEVPTEKELKELLKMLGMKAEELVRKKEPVYKGNFEGKKISEAQWVKILTQHPILIERPILIRGNKAIIGRPIEKAIEFLK